MQIQPARRATSRLDELAGYIVSEHDHVAHGNLSLPHEDAVCAEKSIVPEGELFFLRGLFIGFPQTPLAHAISLTGLGVAQNQTSKHGSLQAEGVAAATFQAINETMFDFLVLLFLNGAVRQEPQLLASAGNVKSVVMLGPHEVVAPSSPEQLLVLALKASQLLNLFGIKRCDHIRQPSEL